MLKKLLKYDLKANLKVYLLMYAVLICTAIGTRLTFIDLISEFEEASSFIVEVASILLVFSYWITLITMNVICVVLIIRRFYQHLFGSEGYLTFTLPVTAEQHFFSKVISAVILYVSCVLVQVISFVILSFGAVKDSQVSEYLGYIIETLLYDTMPNGEVVMQMVLLVIEMLVSLLMVYFAICVGQMVNRHRVMSAVLIYFGLSTLFSAIRSTLGDIFVNISSSYIDVQISYDVAYYVFMGLFLVIELVGFSFGSILIMKKKLNLE